MTSLFALTRAFFASHAALTRLDLTADSSWTQDIVNSATSKGAQSRFRHSLLYTAESINVTMIISLLMIA